MFGKKAKREIELLKKTADKHRDNYYEVYELRYQDGVQTSKVLAKVAEMLGVKENYTSDDVYNSGVREFESYGFAADILAQIKLDDETREEKRRIDRLTPKSKRAEKMEEANDD